MESHSVLGKTYLNLAGKKNQPQEVRSQFHRRGVLLVSLFSLVVVGSDFFFWGGGVVWFVLPPSKYILVYRHSQIGPRGRIWARASCDASSNNQPVPLGARRARSPVLAEGPCGLNWRGVYEDSATAGTSQLRAQGRSLTREARWMVAASGPLNRLVNRSERRRVPGLPIPVQPDRPPPSTPFILPPLIPVHLSILLSRSSSLPPQLAA